MMDVVVVLGASLEAPSKLSKQSVKNIDQLEKLRLKVPIILSGGFYKRDESNTEASLMNLELGTRSGDFGPIYLENKSWNSNENVEFSLNIIQEHGWKDIVIIDQPLHLFQLRLLFKHYVRLKHLNLKLTFISAEAVYGGNVKWWQYSHRSVYYTYLQLSTCYYIFKRKITLRDIIQIERA